MEAQTQRFRSIVLAGTAHSVLWPHDQKLGPLGTAATNWPTVSAPVDRWVWSIWWNENLGSNPGLRGRKRRLIAWAMTRPIVTRLQVGWLRYRDLSPSTERAFFSIMSGPALGSTKFLPNVHRGMKLTTQLNHVPRLRMHRTIGSLCHTLWRGA
jgi:hypothetical protein